MAQPDAVEVVMSSIADVWEEGVEVETVIDGMRVTASTDTVDFNDTVLQNGRPCKTLELHIEGQDVTVTVLPT